MAKENGKVKTVHIKLDYHKMLKHVANIQGKSIFDVLDKILSEKFKKSGKQ